MVVVVVGRCRCELDCVITPALSAVITQSEAPCAHGAFDLAIGGDKVLIGVIATAVSVSCFLLFPLQRDEAAKPLVTAGEAGGVAPVMVMGGGVDWPLLTVAGSSAGRQECLGRVGLLWAIIGEVRGRTRLAGRGEVLRGKLCFPLTRLNQQHRALSFCTCEGGVCRCVPRW
jgi:hypothetical protein